MPETITLRRYNRETNTYSEEITLFLVTKPLAPVLFYESAGCEWEVRIKREVEAEEICLCGAPKKNGRCSVKGCVCNPNK